jgi:uncharacterized protein (DUF362 family)
MADTAKRIVSVVKCAEIDNSDSVREAALESLNLIGGLESLVSPGDTVLLKPNVLCPFDYKTGAVTNPHLVRAMCRLVRAAGASRVIIAESAAVGFDDTMEAFAGSGIAAVAGEEKADLVDLLDTPTICMGIPNGLVFRRLYLPEVFMKANVVINLPVMKTHDVFPATLGLKNMKGLLQQADKKRFHRWGLAQGIVDLNKLVLPQLTVIDGTVAMEGSGPVYGTPVNLGVIVSSFDAVAADAVAATIMGIDPMDIEYIKLAAEQNLGCADMSQIQVVGSRVSEVGRKFKTTKLDFDSYREQGIMLHESGACSGCRHFMESLLTFHLKEDINMLKGYTVVFGQTARLPEKIAGELLLFGSCMRQYRKQGHYIAGCPPHTDEVIRFLRGKAAKTG